MALIAGDWGAVVCLGIVCIMIVMTAGCTFSDTFSQSDMTEEDCLRVSGIDRDHCYKNLAVTSKNSTLCEKIDDPGPNSKCYLELGMCDRLFSQATGDGAYTKFDCFQYTAIHYRSVRLCEENLNVYSSYNRNDLNPTGVSKEICIKRVTEKCGHIGQNACFDDYYMKNYCVEGRIETGKCVSDS